LEDGLALLFTTQGAQPLDAPTNIEISIRVEGVVLNWTASPTANIYYVYRSTDPYSGFAQVGSSTITSYTDDGAAGDEKFFYYVTADVEVEVSTEPENVIINKR